MEKKGEIEKVAIGIDLGGTKILTALVDGEGVVFEKTRLQTRSDKGGEAIIGDILKTIISIRQKEKREITAIGIGVAGQVNSDGVVVAAPNLPFENEPLQARLEEKLNIPINVTNDVRAAAYGEWKYGAGKGAEDIVVIFVGTGIGGGVVSSGQLLEGCTNTFGELGHITLVVGGRKCRCPNYGCIEAYAGGWAIAERAQEAVAKNPGEGEVLTNLAGGIEKITAAGVSKAYNQGDQLAKAIVDETGEYLGSGAVGIVNAFNPCILILGGGVIEGLPELISSVEDVVRKNALKPGLMGLKIVKAALGSDAGVIGAAALALEKSEGDR